MDRKLIFVMINLMAILAVVPGASAHRPEEGSPVSTTIIPNATTSYAFYREMTNPNEVHTYKFVGKENQFFHAGINIPQINGLEDYGVNFAILGPGLPSPNLIQFPDTFDDREANEQLQQLRSGEIGGIFVGNKITESFYEPFTQTNYWGRQQLDVDLPKSGTYYLIIWNFSNQPGKYVLDTGTEEVFYASDLIRFPIWWLNTKLFFEQTPLLIGAISTSLIAMFALVLYKRKSNKNSK